MNKKILILLVSVVFTALIVSGCAGPRVASEKEKEEEEKTVEPEIKETKKNIKNLDLAERELINSLNIKEVDRLQFDYNDGALTNRKKISTIKYDNKGFLQETIIYDENGSVENSFKYSYDADGQRIETKRFGEQGEQDKKYIYHYNEYGNKIKAERYNLTDELEKYYEYKYDSDGNLTDDIWYDKDGSMEYRLEYKYDSKGNKISGKSYDADDGLLYKFEYKYDSKGNLIEEVKMGSRGEKLGIVQYVYKYF